jgi:hypothetical protein
VFKRDIIQTLADLWSMDGHSFYLINQAYMILLQKKKEAEEVKEFRPISLIHSFSKLFTKLLSLRLPRSCTCLSSPTKVLSSTVVLSMTISE